MRLADEAARREAPVREMVEEHLVRHQARHGDDLPSGALDQHVGEAPEVRNRVRSDRQRAHAGNEFVAGAAGQQLALALEQRFPHRVLGRRVVRPIPGRSSSRRAPASRRRRRVLHDVLQLAQHRVSRLRGGAIRAAARVPRHSPKPMRRKPGRSQNARRITVSPSSRNVRVSPLRQRDRLLARRGQLEQRAGLLGRGTGHRARAEQVAGLQVAAVDRVMRDELRDRPVRVTEIRRRQPIAGVAALAHRFGLQPRLERDVDRASVAVRGRVEIRQRRRIAGRMPERAAERRERIERDDPRRDRRREVLREERSERLVLPALDVARAPVVEQHEAEHVLLGVTDRHRLAERVPGAR